MKELTQFNSYNFNRRTRSTCFWAIACYSSQLASRFLIIPTCPLAILSCHAIQSEFYIVLTIIWSHRKQCNSRWYSWVAQRNGVRFFPTHSQSRYPLCCRTSWRMILEWRRTYYGYYPLLVSNQVDSSHFSIDYQAFVDWLDQSLCKAMQTCFYNCADLQHQAQCKRNRLRYDQVMRDST